MSVFEDMFKIDTTSPSLATFGIMGAIRANDLLEAARYLGTDPKLSQTLLEECLTLASEKSESFDTYKKGALMAIRAGADWKIACTNPNSSKGWALTKNLQKHRLALLDKMIEDEEVKKEITKEMFRIAEFFKVV